MAENSGRRDGTGRLKVISRPNEAEYIAEMCGELKEIASRSGLSMLAYFLSLAMIEARAQAPLGAPLTIPTNSRTRR